MKVVIIGGIAAGMSAAAKLKRMSPNDEVIVYDWEGDWCKIKYNGKTGYVHSDYLIF